LGLQAQSVVASDSFPTEMTRGLLLNTRTCSLSFSLFRKYLDNKKKNPCVPNSTVVFVRQHGVLDEMKTKREIC
jgi:hypothetical protein